MYARQMYGACARQRRNRDDMLSEPTSKSCINKKRSYEYEPNIHRVAANQLVAHSVRNTTSRKQFSVAPFLPISHPFN